MQSLVSIVSLAPARAIPQDEDLAATHRRLLALLDDARATLANDPSMRPDTLQRVQAPLHVVLRVGFVLTARATCPAVVLFRQSREGRS